MRTSAGFRLEQVEMRLPTGQLAATLSGKRIDLGVRANAVKKSGAWRDSQRHGESRENASLLIVELQDNDDVSASEDAAQRVTRRRAPSTFIRRLLNRENNKAAMEADFFLIWNP